MDSAPRLEFRPPNALRAGLAVVGFLSGTGALYQASRSLFGHDWGGLLAGAVLLVPALAAVSIVPRVYSLDDSGFELAALGVLIKTPYAGIRWVDDSRGSVTIVSGQRSVEVIFISPGDRDRFLRALIERARLIRSLDPPHGVRARYIPRAKEITFVPHHSRKKTDADSDGMVSSE